jgi:hypothetical protein
MPGVALSVEPDRRRAAFHNPRDRLVGKAPGLDALKLV